MFGKLKIAFATPDMLAKMGQTIWHTGYSSTSLAFATIHSTASSLVAKPSIRRSWPSWYLMMTCQPVPVLSGKGSMTGFSSEGFSSESAILVLRTHQLRLLSCKRR